MRSPAGTKQQFFLCSISLSIPLCHSNVSNIFSPLVNKIYLCLFHLSSLEFYKPFDHPKSDDFVAILVSLGKLWINHFLIFIALAKVPNDKPDPNLQTNSSQVCVSKSR